VAAGRASRPAGRRTRVRAADRHTVDIGRIPDRRIDQRRPAGRRWVRTGEGLANAAVDPALPTEHRAIMRSISGLLLAVFVATLSTNILATALPRILVSLRMDVASYTWVVTAYVLVLTVSVPVWGKLADLWDKKRLLQCVVALYVVSSLVAGSATSAPVLILGRAVQGLGTGGLAALGQVVLAAMIAPRERGRYNGYSGAVVAGGTMAGPLVGGLLVNTPVLGWRACFFVTIPFGIAAAWLIERRLVPTPRRATKVDLDWLGALLLVAATSLLILWVSLLGVDVRAGSWWTPALLGPVLVFGWLFVLVELRHREPLIRIGLLLRRPIMLTSAASFGAGVVGFAMPLFLAQYFQLGRGMSPALSGLATLPAILGIFAASWIVGRLITATGRMKVFLVWAGVAETAGAAGLAWTMRSGAIVALEVATFVIGLGVGCLQQNLVLYAQNVIGPHELGSGSGVVQFSRFLGGSLGLSVGGTLASSRVVVHVTQAFHDLGIPVVGAIPTRVIPLASVVLLTDVRLSRSIRRWPELGEAEAI
jgi:MFS family permease